MTSLATIIGLLPMALKLGTGSEAYAPLARAIIGGLIVSVVATVFIVPAAYRLLHRREERGRDGAGVRRHPATILAVLGAIAVCARPLAAQDNGAAHPPHPFGSRSPRAPEQPAHSVGPARGARLAAGRRER